MVQELNVMVLEDLEEVRCHSFHDWGHKGLSSKYSKQGSLVCVRAPIGLILWQELEEA